MPFLFLFFFYYGRSLSRPVRLRSISFVGQRRLISEKAKAGNNDLRAVELHGRKREGTHKCWPLSEEGTRRRWNLRWVGIHARWPLREEDSHKC